MAIDFNSDPVFMLTPTDEANMRSEISKMFISSERVFAVFQSGRDQVVFTDKRIISVNVQGLMGKKIDYTTLPFAKITAFSVETAGSFDLDSELDLWFSGLGKVRFRITRGFDIVGFSQLISQYVLR